MSANLPSRRLVLVHNSANDDACALEPSHRELSLESESRRIEATHGPNLYSTFLRTHNARPDPMQAATLGKLLGGRVRANDGSMQPPLTVHDKQRIDAVRQRRREWSQKCRLEKNLKISLDLLTQAEQIVISNPRLASDLSELNFGNQLDSAIQLLNRFVREIRDDGEDACAKSAG